MQRITHAVQSVFEGLEIKFVASLVLATLTEVLSYLLPPLQRLFAQDPVFAMAAVLFVLADIVTGVVFNVFIRRSRARSEKAVGGVAKIVLYICLVGGATMIAGAFAGTIFDPIAQVMPLGAYFYVFTTEWISIIENVTGSEKTTKEVFKDLWEKIDHIRGGGNPPPPVSPVV